MELTDVFEGIRPYLSDPKAILDFIEEHKDNSIDELIQNINDSIHAAQGSQKTDFRILLNAFLKQK